jgi:hypothetical protein
MVKIMEVKNFNNNDYKNWLIKMGKDDTKEVIIEYCATVLGQGKECWEALKQGDMTIDKIELKNLDDDLDLEKDIASVSNREIQGFRKILDGVAQIVNYSGKGSDIFDELDDKSMKLVFLDVMSKYSNSIMKAVQRTIHLCGLYMEAKELVETMLEKGKVVQ